MNALKTFMATLGGNNSEVNSSASSIYSIKINLLNGSTLDLSSLKGKYLLIVNVASKCGLTPQYEELQALQTKYGQKLEVIGVPCNQFGRQEPGNSEDILNFCKINYGVSFKITEKTKVKGKDKHALYNWLTNKSNNGVKSSSVKWNFQKYLIDPQGKLVDYYLPTTSPLSAKITHHLK